MNELFQFTVTDTFLIEGRGLILSPFFPVDKFQFDSNEPVRIETPDGHSFGADDDFEIPFVRPTPTVLKSLCVLRNVQKSDVPIGSKVLLLNKTQMQMGGTTL
jgi:hypothetical protein